MLLASHSRGAMMACQLSSVVAELNRATKAPADNGEIVVRSLGLSQ